MYVFPDSYNVKCIEQLLEAISDLEQGFDIGIIFVSLMQKLGNYFGRFKIKNEENNMNENEKQIFETAQNIYLAILKNFNGYMNQNLNRREINFNNSNPTELNKLLNLILSFIKFSLQCSPQEQKFESISNIYSLTLELVNSRKNQINEESINKITN